MRHLQVKVCGMKHPQNIAKVAALAPHFMGFIFYEKSPRYAGTLDPAIVMGIAPPIQKVGVFVDASFDEVLTTATTYRLDFVQLHGNESPQFAERLHRAGCRVWKVFRIDSSVPADMADFAESSEFFLFDTETKAFGGSGKKFDWKLLEKEVIPRPYLLSGGIGPEDLDRLKGLHLKGMIGIDVNSRYEVEPGLKNVELLRRTLSEL